MNIKSLHKYVWALCLALLAAACSLDEHNPLAVSEEAELQTFEGWKKYQATCYRNLYGDGGLMYTQYACLSEMGTDLWTNPGMRTGFLEAHYYQGLTTNYGNAYTIWNAAWGSISACNKTIQNAERLTDGKAEDIKVLVAEARFLRAYYYSVLVAQFGGMPLLLTDDGTQNLSPRRNTVEEVYTQIVDDLKKAAADLPITPYENNGARVTKKAALGILARVYAQGAGEKLTEGGKSYWQCALEVADDLIVNKATYGADLYADFAEVFASANNRNNKEALFTAYGRDPYNPSSIVGIGIGNMNLGVYHTSAYGDAFGGGNTDILKQDVGGRTTSAYYGRCNDNNFAPTKYLIDAFNAQHDKRWEHSFTTAVTNYSGEQAMATNGANADASVTKTYADVTVTLTADMCTKYGIDAAHVGKKIYPYVDLDAKDPGISEVRWQYVAKEWKKGANDGNIATSLVEMANADVHPYPLDETEDRFIAYMSKEPLDATEKAKRAYITINIDDLFASDAGTKSSTYKSNAAGNGLPLPNFCRMHPNLLKFNHNFDGGRSANFQTRVGNIMVMRMAEVYLIAAEATANGATGGSLNIEGYLKPLRDRAVRSGSTVAEMSYDSDDIDDVLDEYARELCGEFNRWPILKRNGKFEDRLQKYNARAFTNFDPAKHYLRPIPYNFLTQIENAAEFGTNGY